jgi:hypothetical protein
MSIDGSGAHRIYQPETAASHTEAQAALERDPRDWTGAGYLPLNWIAALSDLDPLAQHSIDIGGTKVTFTVAVTTDDPAAMVSALRQLRRVVADAPATQPEVPIIEKRLPRQIGSARWHTPSGDITVIQPGQGRHRRPPRRRFAAFGTPIAAVWALLHGLRSSAAPLGAAAGIAAVAMVPVLPSPPTTPAHPVPGHTREVFVPAHVGPVSPTLPPQAPPRTRLAAPAPSAAATSTTPDPAGSPRRSPAVIALPTLTATVPAATPAPTKSSTLKVKGPSLRKAAKRTCVTVQLPLLHKKVTTCKQG